MTRHLQRMGNWIVADGISKWASCALRQRSSFPFFIFGKIVRNFDNKSEIAALPGTFFQG